MACLPLFFSFSLFVSVFVSLLLLFVLCLSLLWLSLLVLLHCLSFPALSLCFLFPLRTTRKKKGRKGFAPCVLSSCVVGCFILLPLCIPRIRLVSARLHRNKVLEKGNLNGCSKLFCARRCSCLYNSKFVLFLFPYLFLLVGSYFLSPFRLLCLILLL